MNFCRRAETAHRKIHVNVRKANASFGSNRISNTKYSWWSFVFQNLFEQFSRPMNMYFLFIACLQLIREITPVDPLTTWAPLAVIFAITAVKEAVDDYGRWRQDREANGRLYLIVLDGKEVSRPASDIHVGDVIKLRENDEIPCDAVVLASSADNGGCFIQTTNLDGESNLKSRTCLKSTAHLKTAKQVGDWHGAIVCPPPDDDLDRFEGQLYMDAAALADASKAQGLTRDNLLLQATHLRNTEWVFATAVYVGNATKFGRNKKAPPAKFTRTDDAINELSVYIFIFQLVLVAILGAVGNVFKMQAGQTYWFLRFDEEEPLYQVMVIPARFLLLNSTMIPISLRVTLDLCKLYYSKFIEADAAMAIAGKPGTNARCNSTALAEDLGQIEYVLTDKTGTLTQNVMVLRACMTADGVQYGELPTISMEEFASADSSKLTDRRLSEELSRNKSAGRRDSCALELLRSLAVNNDVQISRGEGGAVEFKASSPDEEAFVRGAANFGIELDLREGAIEDQRVRIKENGEERLYTQLAVFPFSSDRKRMTVIVRCPDSTLRVYIKGADDKILAKGEAALCAPGQERQIACLESQIEKYAVLGLRTLVMGYKDLSAEEYSAWRVAHDRAAAVLSGRDAALERSYAAMERNFILLGATAIEDKLQDGVPETIANLRRAHVRFWMCTGDKPTTAHTIAKTCRLLPRNESGREIPPLPLYGKDAATVKKVVSVVAAQLQASGYSQLPGIKPRVCCNPFCSAWPGGGGSGSMTVTSDMIPVMVSEASAPAAGASPAKTAGSDVRLIFRTSEPSSSTMSPLAHGKEDAPESLSSHTSFELPPVTDPSDEESRASLIRGLKHVKTPGSAPPRPYTLLVHGSVLRIALESCPLEFATICLSAKSVICCRVTPRQKAQLVRLVRDAGYRVLAIGDGGNDVSMIQEAQIGVGIRGKEGLQASRAADYQVAQFQALERLLLVHGHYAYYRTALVAQYSFYKSFVFCVIQILFASMSAVAGTSLFNSLCVAAYNAALFVPIVFFFVDKDVEQETTTRHADIYVQGARNTLLNHPVFLQWILRAAFHAGLMFFLLVFIIPSLQGRAGTKLAGVSLMDAYESMGLLMFASYVLVQDFVMLFELRRVTWYNVISIFGMHALAIGIGFLTNRSSAFNNFIDRGSFDVVLTSPAAWLTQFLMLVACIVPTYAALVWSVHETTSESAVLYALDADTMALKSSSGMRHVVFRDSEAFDMEQLLDH